MNLAFSTWTSTLFWWYFVCFTGVSEMVLKSSSSHQRSCRHTQGIQGQIKTVTWGNDGVSVSFYITYPPAVRLRTRRQLRYKRAKTWPHAMIPKCSQSLMRFLVGSNNERWSARNTVVSHSSLNKNGENGISAPHRGLWAGAALSVKHFPTHLQASYVRRALRFSLWAHSKRNTHCQSIIPTVPSTWLLWSFPRINSSHVF